MKKKRLSTGSFIEYAITVVWVSVTIITLGWVFVTSLKSNSELFVNVWGLPQKLQFDNYFRAWTYGRMQIYFLNTVVILIFTQTFLTAFGSMASYALTRYRRYKWTQWAYMAIIAGMSIPAQITIVPLYIEFSKFGLLNTHAGIILVYCAVFLPFTVFVLSGFFRTIPLEVEEAAEIDGCTKWGIFSRIVVPMAKPGIVTIIIFNFLSIWNEYFFSMILITKDNKMPLSAGLYNLKSQQQMGMDWAALFAGVVILLVPTMVMFFILQDKIAKGVTAGAIKG